MRWIFLAAVWLFISCGSARLVDSDKKHPAQFKMQKVLVVGSTSNTYARRKFEEKLAQALQKEGMEAQESLALYGDYFSIAEKSEDDLRKLKKELAAQGYNSIILSKTTREKEQLNLGQSLNVFQRIFGNKEDDVYNNKVIYKGDENPKKVFRTETTLYSLDGTKSKLVWTGKIDIVNPRTIKDSVRKYVYLLMATLRTEGFLPSY